MVTLLLVQNPPSQSGFLIGIDSEGMMEQDVDTGSENKMENMLFEDFPRLSKIFSAQIEVYLKGIGNQLSTTPATVYIFNEIVTK